MRIVKDTDNKCVQQVVNHRCVGPKQKEHLGRMIFPFPVLSSVKSHGLFITSEQYWKSRNEKNYM